jgi:hypothetical protein
MWFSMAYSKQGAFMEHSAQIFRAASTPAPSEGKNVPGGKSLHMAFSIQSVEFIIFLLTEVLPEFQDD